MPYATKAAKAAYMRDYYRRNRERLQEYRREYAATSRKALAEYKSSRGCERCGESDPHCLQFHHTTGKEFTIGQRHGRKSLETLLAEAEKCTVLCANCHFKEHSN